MLFSENTLNLNQYIKMFFTVKYLCRRMIHPTLSLPPKLSIDYRCLVCVCFCSVREKKIENPKKFPKVLHF